MPPTVDEHWQKVWSQRRPDEVSWFQSLPERSLRLVTTFQTDRKGAIIDVGGGASPLVDALLDAGYVDLTVLDIAPEALDHARERLADRAHLVRWVVADVTRSDDRHQVALWHDRAVFHFLIGDEDRRRYVDRMAATVVPAGHAILATFALDGPEQCSGLPVKRYGPDELADVLAPAFTPVLFEHELHVTPAGGEQSFVYGVFRRDGGEATDPGVRP